MVRRRTNPDFLTGVPELLVLRLISRQPMHGYAVVQAIKLQSDGKLEFGEGSIYPVLHRLESDGMLQTESVVVSGRQRVIYEITPKGLTQLEESRSTWQQVVGCVESILQEPSDENRSVA